MKRILIVALLLIGAAAAVGLMMTYAPRCETGSKIGPRIGEAIKIAGC